MGSGFGVGLLTRVVIHVEFTQALEPHQETGEVMEPLSKAEFQRLKVRRCM